MSGDLTTKLEEMRAVTEQIRCEGLNCPNPGINEAEFALLVLNALPILILHPETLEMKRVSKPLADPLGYTVSELENTPFNILLTPQIRDKSTEELTKWLTNPRPISLSSQLGMIPLLSKDGHEYPSIVDLYPSIINQRLWIVVQVQLFKR